MTKQELNKEIIKIEKDIDELERDLYYTRYNVTQEILKREINTYKHVLKQYKEMINL